METEILTVCAHCGLAVSEVYEGEDKKPYCGECNEVNPETKNETD
jgi:hypothetical protein